MTFNQNYLLGAKSGKVQTEEKTKIIYVVERIEVYNSYFFISSTEITK